MTQLVEVARGTVVCDSQAVAEKFGHRHLYIVGVIERLIEEIKGSKLLPLNFKEIRKSYRGQEFKAYTMDREAFSLLAMRFSGKKALEWQVKFNSAFYLMEKQLLLEASNKTSVEWKQQREQGKLVRKTATDVIKDFVEYATAQGSQSAQYYYKHVTLACYKCLSLVESKQPKLRDTLDLLQLNQLMLAEHIAEKSMRKHMAAGEHYKAVFALVKADLERFADGLMLT